MESQTIQTKNESPKKDEKNIPQQIEKLNTNPNSNQLNSIQGMSSIPSNSPQTTTTEQKK